MRERQGVGRDQRSGPRERSFAAGPWRASFLFSLLRAVNAL